MKKTLKLSALIMAFVIVIGMMATALAATTGTVKLSSGTMSIRKTASTKSASLGTLKNGAKITIVSQSGDWYKITSGKVTGYVMKKYVTVSGATSSSTSSSSSSAVSVGSTGTAKAATKLYKTASTKSTVLATIPKNGTVKVVAGSTTSYYKVTYNSKTGYVVKTQVTMSGTSSSSSNTNATKPGDTNGYSSSTITKPNDTVTTKAEVFNAVNYNFSQFKTKFVVNIKDFNVDKLPQSTSAIEYSFLNGVFGIEAGTASNGVTPVTFTAAYSDGGVVMANLRNGTAIPSSNKTATELKAKVDSILKELKIDTLSDYNKVVAIHDYIVKNTNYDSKMPAASRTAHGVLVGKSGSCQGYAEATNVLFTAAGLENRFVWAKSKINASGTHGFNKVKVNGKWYNVDCTVDDPQPNDNSRIKRDFLLVSDTISKQRYTWEESRYPAATSMTDNYHYKNNLVADTQAKLESLVKAGVAKKQTSISVWIPSYSTGKFSTAFASKISGVKSAKATTVGAASSYKTWGTAIYFKMTY